MREHEGPHALYFQIVVSLGCLRHALSFFGPSTLLPCCRGLQERQVKMMLFALVRHPTTLQITAAPGGTR